MPRNFEETEVREYDVRSLLLLLERSLDRRQRFQSTKWQQYLIFSIVPTLLLQMLWYALIGPLIQNIHGLSLQKMENEPRILVASFFIFREISLPVGGMTS